MGTPKLEHYHGINSYEFALGEVGGEWDAGLTVAERDQCKPPFRRQLWAEGCYKLPAELIASSPEEAIKSFIEAFHKQEAEKGKKARRFVLNETDSAVTKCCIGCPPRWQSCNQFELYVISPLTGGIKRWEIEVEYEPETPKKKGASGGQTKPKKKKKSIPVILQVSWECVYAVTKPPTREELECLLPLRDWLHKARGTKLRAVHDLVFPPLQKEAGS